MILNGMDMSVECGVRFDEYIAEIEVKNKMKFDESQLQNLRSIFQAGFSGCLQTIIPKEQLK